MPQPFSVCELAVPVADMDGVERAPRFPLSRNTLREEKQINLGRDLPPSSLISLKIPHPLPPSLALRALLDQRVSRQTGKIVPVHIGSARWKMEGMMGWMLAWPRSVVRSVVRLNP